MKTQPDTSLQQTSKLSPKTANLLLLLVAIIWGGGFIAGKVALETVSPQWILFVRFSLAALCMGLLFSRQIKTAAAACVRWGLALGILQYAGLFIQLFALQYTTTAKQSFLAATYVLFTPFVAWLIFRRKISLQSYLAAALALCGIAFLSLGDIQKIQSGDFLTLGFALIFSVQIVLVGKLSQRFAIIPLTFYQMLGAAVFAGVTACLSGLPEQADSLRSVLGILYLGILNTAVAFGLQNFAQRFTSAAHTALLLSLESVFGLAFSLLFYGDPFTLRMGIGCVLIFLSLLVSNHNPGRQADGRHKADAS